MDLFSTNKWEEVRLTEICSPKQWKTLSTKELIDEGFPVYGANGIIGFHSSFNHERPTILITCRGATCGSLNISRPFSYVNGNAMALDGLDESRVTLRFLFYFLKFTGFNSVISGSAQPQITKSNLEKIYVKFPELRLQDQIVAKLDSLLARVESCRAHLDRAAATIKRFRQSTLFLAISTPLFISENADEIWKTFYLKDVADIQLGKMLDKAKNRGKEVDYLRNVNVRWFSFDLADVKKMRLPESELANFSVKDGDVFICEGGEPGRAAVWRNGRNHFVYQKALHRVRLSDAILPEWLVFCLKVDAEKSGLEEYFTGTTIKHLTGVALKRYRFMAPSVKAQRLIVEKIFIDGGRL